MIVAAQVQHAVQHEDLDFLLDGVAELPCLRACAPEGDGDVAEEGTGIGRRKRLPHQATWDRRFRLSTPEPFLGDIAISLGRARAQAREFGHSIEQEVQILMLHGVLHLCGHDHEADSGAMARAEKRWRAKLGLPNGLIERVRS